MRALAVVLGAVEWCEKALIVARVFRRLLYSSRPRLPPTTFTREPSGLLGIRARGYNRRLPGGFIVASGFISVVPGRLPYANPGPAGVGGGVAKLPLW